MRVPLETSVLFGPAIDDSSADAAISATSLAELHFGVLLARTPESRAERLRRLAVVEKTFDALPVDDRIAREYARLAAAAAQSGTQSRSRFADLLIAATAAAHAAELWTHNVADLAGLERLIPFRPPPTA